MEYEQWTLALANGLEEMLMNEFDYYFHLFWWLSMIQFIVKAANGHGIESKGVSIYNETVRLNAKEMFWK